MSFLDLPALLNPIDLAALATLLLSWFAIGWYIENPPANRPSVSRLMATYRRQWMDQMLTRDPRIFDAQLIGQLRQGAAFFASATMLAIGGAMALVGNTEPLRKVAQDLTQRADPAILLELKMILLVLMISMAFLRYVWAHRLFGYTAVLMAAVPNDPEHSDAATMAAKAGEIGVLAARAFTRGMRTTYFALASAAWLLGPWALIAATLATVAMLWRREFTSASREVLLRDHA